MIGNETQLVQIVRPYLPHGAEPAVIEGPQPCPAILAVDLDGDQVWEIAAAYRLNQELHLLVLKYGSYGWFPVADVTSPGQQVRAMHAAPAAARGSSSLIVGWRIGAIWSKLSVYEMTPSGLRDITPGDYYEDTTSREPDYSDFSRTMGLLPASVKSADGVKWGYIDRTGAMVLQPQFDYANDFQENGLAVVRAVGRDGLIRTSGQYVVPPGYDSIGTFSEGRAAVIDSQGFKLMDETGHILTKKAYSYISTMHDGRAMFYVMSPDGISRYGYLDKQGGEIIPPQFEQAGDFDNGRAVVKIKDGEYALIKPDGSRLATYPYAYVGAWGDGLLPFQQEPNGKYGYIDEAGKVVIAPVYTGAQSFQDGRAVVNTAEDYRSSYGLIDKQGRYVVKPGYNEIRQLGEERVALGKAIDPKEPYIGSTFAIADTKGQVMTGFHYLEVTDYKKGLASVYDQSQTYFIDRTGKAAPGYPRLSGNGTLSLQDSLIQANIDQRLSYVTRDGRLVWRQNVIIPLRAPYRIREEKYKPNKDYLVYVPQVEGMTDRGAMQRVNARLKELSQVKPVPANKQLDYSYTGDFEVAFFREDLLVLELTGYNFPFGAAHGMPAMIYVHINLVDGRIYELKDLFKPGSHYTRVLSDIVGKQIKEDPQYSYVFPDSYKGIKPDQPFFVTENALHLYFEPYEIGPYAAGFPTFTIPYREIMNIIATDGGFWRSFH